MKPSPLLALACLTGLASCHAPSAPTPDHPSHPPGVRVTDIVLKSNILHADIPVRIVAPADISLDATLPVVYLLHGAGENYRTWTNDSPVADLASDRMILVMPDAHNTYYLNDAASHRYEDFFFTELIPDVHRRFPTAATDRAHAAIIGNSRGGYGAAVYALKHPQVFSYVGLLSPAIDLAERHFRWHAPLQSLYYRRSFGPIAGEVRLENDPYSLAASIAPQDAPYIYIVCGNRDGLLAPDRRFAAVLTSHRLPYEFHIVPGAHGWSTWTPQLAALETSLLAHFASNTLDSHSP